MGLLERWDRRNQTTLRDHNEKAKDRPLVTQGALAVITADFTLHLAWMLFLVGTVLVVSGSAVAIGFGTVTYVLAAAALVVGVKRTWGHFQKSRAERRSQAGR